jgi:protein tyrosine/serine phosphatase
MRIRKLHLAFLVLIVPAAPSAYFGFLQAGGNFHAVAPGKLYRSAQPSARELADYAQAYGIKSVINLRGKHEGEPWYDDEMRISKEIGLHHIDLALSAGREPSAPQILELEKALRVAPGPILVHCKSGSDRTGLAAALYALKIEHLPVEAAAAQLSWVYGHWPYFWSRSAAMDRAFEHAVSLHSEDRQGN